MPKKLNKRCYVIQLQFQAILKYGTMIRKIH